MYDFLISKEQTRQFAFDCFDAILNDVKEMEEQEIEADDNSCKCA